MLAAGAFAGHQYLAPEIPLDFGASREPRSGLGHHLPLGIPRHDDHVVAAERRESGVAQTAGGFQDSRRFDGARDRLELDGLGDEDTEDADEPDRQEHGDREHRQEMKQRQPPPDRHRGQHAATRPGA